MLDIGSLCTKTAGRDAGNACVVVEKIDDDYVLIDGNVRRRKCNIKHLHPQKKKLAIKAKASTKEVLDALKKEGIPKSKKGGFRGPSGTAKPKAAKKQEAPKEAEPEKPKVAPKRKTEKQAAPKKPAKKPAKKPVAKPAKKPTKKK